MNLKNCKNLKSHPRSMQRLKLVEYAMLSRPEASPPFFPSVLFIHDNADNAKCQAEDKVKSLEKSIMLLTKEKDAEILELQLEKARLQGHVTSIEKVIA
ncbi:hypothetical protein AgCh_015040 [Apium graveolens]